MKLIHLSFLFSTLVLGVLSLPKAEKCLLDFESGPEDNFTLHYWFNKTAEQCEAFWYGGSGGNDNRFETLDDCINLCDSEEEEILPGFLSKDVCLLKIDSGRYENWTLQFAFNEETGQCEEFHYGGRGGNANRFKTHEECVDHCEPMNESLVLETHTKEDCLLDIDNGEDGNWKEYYGFVKAENTCVRFFYGGSGGNGNRFNTEKECRWFCKQVAVTKKHEEELESSLYDSLSFWGADDDICPKKSCLDTQNHARYIVLSYLLDRLYNTSEDVLMRISVKIDAIINEDNLVYKPYNLKEIVKNISKAVTEELKNVNKFGNFLNDQEFPVLFKALLDKINSVEAYTSTKLLKDELMKTILEKMGPLEKSVEDKISDYIDEVFTQYHELTWFIFRFTIAHDVNYYVNKALAK